MYPPHTYVYSSLIILADALAGTPTTITVFNPEQATGSPAGPELPWAPLTCVALQGRLGKIYKSATNQPERSGEEAAAPRVTWVVAELAVAAATVCFDGQRDSFPGEACTRERMIGYLAFDTIKAAEWPELKAALAAGRALLKQAKKMKAERARCRLNGVRVADSLVCGDSAAETPTRWVTVSVVEELRERER